MKTFVAFRYLSGVSSLQFSEDRCRSCGLCLDVCPRQVFARRESASAYEEIPKIFARDKDACIECGACARNCPYKAISLKPGAGCATLILQQWLSRYGWKGKLPKSGDC